MEKTFDYNIFKKLNGNRSIDSRNLKIIIESMKVKFLIRPIDVNQDMEIIDGQHRLEACKLLNLPVYYNIRNDWSLEEAHILNSSQKNWTTKEYLQGYCDLGKLEYFKFQSLLERYLDLSFNVILTCSVGGSHSAGFNAKKSFEAGNFKFKNFDRTIYLLSSVYQLKEFTEYYNRAGFCRAFFMAMENKEFDFNIFKKKLKYLSRKLDGCVTYGQYLKSIEDIINYKSRKIDKIRLI